jgi:T5SS/PEP-CTERM-associated repeat protein
LVVILGTAGLTARAADSVWTNLAGGLFATPGNWSAGVPGAPDKATFNSNATYTVTWGAPATNNAALFDALDGSTVTLNPGINQWTLTNSMTIGGSGGSPKVTLQTGTLSVATTVDVGKYWEHNNLTITNGAHMTVGGAFNIGSQGVSNSLAIVGQGSMLTVTGYLGVGQNNGVHGVIWNGQSTVVSNGGAVRVSGGCGISGSGAIGDSFVVDGTGSVFDAMGNYCYVYGDRMNLSIVNGGQFLVTNSAFAFISGPNNSLICVNSRLTVAGTGSLLNVNGMQFLSGGLAFSNNLIQASNGGRIAGLTWQPISGLNCQIVAKDTGTLVQADQLNMKLDPSSVLPGVVITNGAVWSNSILQIYLGSVANSCGEIRVSGTGSLLTNAPLPNQWNTTFYLGYASNTTGRITIQNGGKAVMCQPNLASLPGYIGYNQYATGELVVGGSNSLFQMIGAPGLAVGVDGAGRLTVSNGGMVIASQTVIGANATSTNNTVEVVGGGSVITNSGTFEVRRGTLRFTADAAGFGQVLFGGAMTNSATARLEVNVGAYQFQHGMDFVLVDYGTLTSSNMFASGNVVVTGGYGGKVDQLTGGSISVHFYGHPGTLFMGR